MTSTESLLLRLAADAAPVRRLRPPVLRAFGFSALAVALLLVLFLVHGARAGLGEALAVPEFAIRLIAAGATGVTAAIAALTLAVPGRPLRWALLPALPFAAWVGAIGHSCLVDWVAGGMAPGAREEAVRCATTLLGAGVPLSIAMVLMLRAAAPPRPWVAAMLGGLAAAGFTAFALALLHPIDTSAAILAWNGGCVLLFTGAETLAAARGC
jgi:hypothetical protein